MSKAELFQQLETLSPSDLDEVMERITILRFAQEHDELTPYEREILEERISQFEKDGDKGEPYEVVRTRLRAALKK